MTVRTECGHCRDHITCIKNRGLDRDTWVKQGKTMTGMRVTLTEHRTHSLLPAVAPTLPKSSSPRILGQQGPEEHFTSCRPCLQQ